MSWLALICLNVGDHSAVGQCRFASETEVHSHVAWRVV